MSQRTSSDSAVLTSTAQTSAAGKRGFLQRATRCIWPAGRQSVPSGHVKRAGGRADGATGRCARRSPARSAGACRTPTRPSKASRNRQRPRIEQRPFESWDQLRERSRTSSDVSSDRSSYSPPQPDCDRANDSRSSCATSITKHASFTSAARTATAGSNARRPTPASTPSHCKRSRSRRSTPYPDATAPRSCSPPRAAATSTYTTSATGTGSPPSARSGSTPSEGSTI
jgi:hypothetical protein